MGVPKFTRFICERYPCLLEVLNDYQIPEFDNLYLDMNGIIHCCSHPNDADAHFRITEETIFKNIFLYVEILFRTIKPQKLFFMAVDGVAPRAKINQQRSRRFRSAKEAEVAEAKARAKGEKLPEEARFDSNCITPGTAFMEILTEQLRDFVAYKISTDKLWQKCKVIVSGPEVPGEGEHKIMDYIRFMKAQPDHDPNTRHCLYGLDADLVILSLCTHEPHFAVLREEVKYGRNPQKTTIAPEKTKFCLLHVSLLREYMEHEFEAMKGKLPFPFDLEKIIDDWILMGFLIGNDFIPHLPNLHIASGALPTLYQAYMETLPTLDGYINEAGTLNLPRFEKFMAKLAVLDVKHFTEHQADLKYFESKTGRRPNDNERTSYRNSKDSPMRTPVKKGFRKDLENLIQSTEDMLLGHSDEEGDLLDSDSDTETYALEFQQHKQEYYMKKLNFDKVDAEVLRQQAEAYVTAIQWNLHYYYDGCCSWSWYYPHHYAPFISDIKDFKHLQLDFDMAGPFRPFQQLLAVLPAASKNLLPEAYHELLTDQNSPIIDYYPDDFKTDMNEKKQEWEAVVLIPFIDEKRLIDAMEPYDEELTTEERRRNRHGPMYVMSYSTESSGLLNVPHFPTTEHHAKIVPMSDLDIQVPTEKLNKGLMPGAKLSVYFPGFPTLQYLKHEAKFDKCKVRVFEQPSRGDNMMITIAPKPAPELNQLATELLGQIVFIKWPHLLEAHVTAVSDGSRKISLIDPKKPYAQDNVSREELKGQAEMQWRGEARDVSMGYKSRFGIIVGDIEALVHVQPITGRRYILTSHGRMSLEKEWSSIPSYYPYHSIVRDIEVEATGNISHKNVTDIYFPTAICFMLGHPHYGAMGEVVEPGLMERSGRVRVAMRTMPHPDFSGLKRAQHQSKMQYMHGSIAAQRLGISSHLLSRITGSIFVVPNCEGDKKQQNVGLNLKFNKRNEELPGYTRKYNGQWTYSSKSVGLIMDYMDRWPGLFERLVENVGNDVFNEEDLFVEDEDVMDVVKWLKNQPFRSLESRNCDYEGLEPEIISQMDAEIDEFFANESLTGKTIIMQVRPHLLFKPGLNDGNIPPDPKAQHSLFDRIISVKENSSVPLGYKGTIINMQGLPGATDTIYEILFDTPFISGISFSGGANSKRGKLHAAEFINISHGLRFEQDIAGASINPDKIPQKPQVNSDSTGTSAFASFNAQGNSLFGKGKQVQGQVQKQVQKQVQGQIQEQKQIQGQVKVQKQVHGQVQVQKQVQGHAQVPKQVPGHVQVHKEAQGHVQIQKQVPGHVQVQKQVPGHLQGHGKVQKQVQGHVQVQGHNEVQKGVQGQVHGHNQDLLVNLMQQNKKIGSPVESVPPITVRTDLMNQKLQNIADSEVKKPDPSEFQMLWNELQKKPNQKSIIPPFPQLRPNVASGSIVPGANVQQQLEAPQDPSAFLKAVLRIPDDSSTEAKSAKPGLPFTFPTPPANPQNPSSTAPALVQQMFDHARQSRTELSYCAKLLSHYQLMGIGMPRYFYSSQKNLIHAQIVLPDMRTFYGELCANHQLAAESAAKKVYTELNLDNGPKPRYLDLLPPNSWLPPRMNVPPAVNPPPVMMLPRSVPDAQNPPPRPPAMWNPMMSQTPGFTQVAPPRMGAPMMPGTSQNDKDVKQTAPFVPLQAQKKTRPRHNKDKGNDAGHQKEAAKIKVKPKENSPKVAKEEKTKENEEKGKEPVAVQKSHKNPRQRRSRIAANFGGANGSEK